MIRKMLFSDIEQVSKIEQICFKSPWSKSEFMQLLNLNDTLAIVWDEDNEIVGYGIGILFNSYLHIANLAVKPTFRRKGIGSNLIFYMIDYAHKNHKEFITLEVRSSNLVAINLYKKLGFKREGIKKFYYPNGEDAIVMKRRVWIDKRSNLS